MSIYIFVVLVGGFYVVGSFGQSGCFLLPSLIPASVSVKYALQKGKDCEVCTNKQVGLLRMMRRCFLVSLYEIVWNGWILLWGTGGRTDSFLHNDCCTYTKGKTNSPTVSTTQSLRVVPPL
ncbi:hypothetical protein QBC43DRAFT_44186 [Cladorrhinum sp. PSN259]|nr:hypothetical protein QBC43DRAFT_44186 [Cladorrhinum sp. PSN259]